MSDLACSILFLSDDSRYLVGKKLGSGKFSDVYLGYDKEQDLAKVVIKILRPNKLEKILREIALLRKADKIKDIAHLLGVTKDPVYEVPSLVNTTNPLPPPLILTSDLTLQVFEFMPGKTLRGVLNIISEKDIRLYAYKMFSVSMFAWRIQFILSLFFLLAGAGRGAQPEFDTQRCERR